MSVALAPTARRLTVPADRVDPRETLVTTAPWWLGGAPPDPTKPVSPPVLSFEGDSFLEDFLAAAGDKSLLPGLLAWRDWSEPPAGMLDPKGAKLYPASIVRAIPLTVEPESEPPGVLDADGVPHASPAWLRKLYLPLHLRFHFVAFDLVCQRAGWPPVDKARVTAAGAVVRRLVRDPAGERWEDWLSADGKTGLWFELKGGLPADPDTIPSAAFRDSANVAQDAAIAARLGLKAPSAAAPLTLGLESVKLSKLPETVAGIGLRCSLYGLLPVFSAAQQAPDEATGQTAAQLAAAFQAQAQATLTAAWADDAGLRARLAPAVTEFLESTVLPASINAVPGAIQNIQDDAQFHDPFNVPTDAEIVAFADTVLDAALKRYQHAIVPTTTDPHSVTEPNAQAFWVGAAHIDQAALAVPGQSSGPASTLSNQTADWNVLVISRLRQIASSLSAGGLAAGDADRASALMAVAVGRLRRLRMALLADLRRRTDATSDTTSIAAIQTQTIHGVAYAMPGATAAGVGAEIEALLGVDAVRSPADIAPDWPPFDLSAAYQQMLLRAHRAGLALEALLGPLDAAGAGAGGAYESKLDDATKTQADRLRTYFGLTGTGEAVLRAAEAGFDLREQPARGLIVFPRPAPAASVFQALATQVAGSYTAGAPATQAEAKARARVHRLRYDHSSLYAVWCWARVAGRNDCENETIAWTGRSEPFSIAEPTDVLGARPVTVQLPDLPRLLRDIPRIAKARAKPFAAFNTPPNSSYNVGDDPKDTSRAWGIGWICSFAIPVITICAFILFSIIFSILIILPSFSWMLLLKFCIPIPVPKKS